MPHDLLLIDLQQAACSSVGSASEGAQLYCSAQLGAAAAVEGEGRAPVRTRAVAVGAGGAAAWQERLILALPIKPGAHSGQARVHVGR